MDKSSNIMYIYVLRLNGKIIYVGKTKSIKKRLKEHKSSTFNNDTNRDLYKYLRKNTTRENFYTLIKMEVIKEVNEKEAEKIEKKAIEKCLSNGIYLFNSCVFSLHKRFKYFPQTFKSS